MGILKRKVWSPIDLVCLKWSSIFFGMIVGSIIPVFIRQNLWLFILAAILLAIKPIQSYFDNRE
jgi:hypothetical protein